MNSFLDLNDAFIIHEYNNTLYIQTHTCTDVLKNEECDVYVVTLY